MTVSVAMATYNGGDYIKEQLDSIIRQTRLPDEIVVCDDCSSDNTLQITQDYAIKYNCIKWIIIKNNKNQGYIKSFFNAIKKTSGDVIVLCDQDDIWDRCKIEFFIDCFSKRDDMLSLHTDYSIINQNNEIIGEHKIGYKSELEKIDIYRFCKRLNYCGMSSAFHKDLKLNLLSINLDTIPTHDWTIHALAVIRDGMYVSSKVTSFRRYTGRNVALNIDESVKREGVKQRIRVVKEFYEYYCLLQKFDVEVGMDENNRYINRIIDLQVNRLNYLTSFSLWKWLVNVKNIKMFPSIKSYICDVLYILKIY